MKNGDFSGNVCTGCGHCAPVSSGKMGGQNEIRENQCPPILLHKIGLEKQF